MVCAGSKGGAGAGVRQQLQGGGVAVAVLWKRGCSEKLDEARGRRKARRHEKSKGVEKEQNRGVV